MYNYTTEDCEILKLSINKNNRISLSYRDIKLSYENYIFVDNKNIVQLCNLSENKDKNILIKDLLGSWIITKNGRCLTRYDENNEKITNSFYIANNVNMDVSYHMVNEQIFTIHVTYDNKIHIQSLTRIRIYDTYQFI